METEGREDEGSSPQSDPPQSRDSLSLNLNTQEFPPVENSVPVEELVLVDKQAIEKLTKGLLSHYLPDLQNSKQALQELTDSEDRQESKEKRTCQQSIGQIRTHADMGIQQNQVILMDTLDQEVTKFRECNALLDLNSLFTEAKFYHSKLVNVRKEMMMLHEKTTKLKKRALKLQQQRQKEALEKEQQREKELERERLLIAKPAKRA